MVGGLQIFRYSFTAKVCGFGSWELWVYLQTLSKIVVCITFAWRKVKQMSHSIFPLVCFPSVDDRIVPSNNCIDKLLSGQSPATCVVCSQARGPDNSWQCSQHLSQIEKRLTPGCQWTSGQLDWTLPLHCTMGKDAGIGEDIATLHIVPAGEGWPKGNGNLITLNI